MYLYKILVFILDKGQCSKSYISTSCIGYSFALCAVDVKCFKYLGNIFDGQKRVTLTIILSFRSNKFFFDFMSSM